MIFIGADHRGFELKERLKKRLEDDGYQITDLGNDHLDGNDDYVIFAEKVAKAVAENINSFGIILCGSGAGVDIVANKIDNIRSALAFDITRAKQAREDEDANVISLPADTLDEETGYEIVKTFLTTQFSEAARHIRRLKELEKVEEEN